MVALSLEPNQEHRDTPAGVRVWKRGGEARASGSGNPEAAIAAPGSPMVPDFQTHVQVRGWGTWRADASGAHSRRKSVGK